LEFGFLNAWMLLGVAGVALPVIAHLLSKRRFDVVQWGAMQFLELGQRARRRFHLQDLLLLLLRMGLLACLALAIARPWGSGQWLGLFGSPVQNDFVFILDGSASMAWEEQGPGSSTPHQQAIQWIHQALEQVQPGDTISLIDARMQPLRLIAPPVSDARPVREILKQIAPPSGTSSLPDAIQDAMKILATATNPSRRIVLLTDDQALTWNLKDDYAWGRIEELRKQFKVTPQLEAVVFGESQAEHVNFSVGKIELSRTLTVPGFPVRLRAMVRQSGGKSVAQRQVILQLNGQTVPDQHASVDLLPDGEALVEFEQTFADIGNFVATFVLPADQLPSDDQSSAVISISSSIPILLVDGDPAVDSTQGETFYLQSAFASSGGSSPWILAKTVRPQELSDALLADQKVVFLCNVDRLTLRQWGSLRQYVRDGGGLVLAPGSRADSDALSGAETEEGGAFLPARLDRTVEDQVSAGAAATTIDTASLETPWLQRFRVGSGMDLGETRFARWWKLVPVQAARPQPQAGASILGAPLESSSAAPQILATFSQGDPWIMQRPYGDGAVVMLATPLDADWSTFPAKNDFVPFLHELVFMLSAGSQHRNIDVGSPLLLPVTNKESSFSYVVNGPGAVNAPAELTQRGHHAFVQFRRTSMPGLYRISKRNDAAESGEPFFVDDDHRESDLTRLAEADWQTITADRHVHRITEFADILRSTAGDAPRAEFWWLLLLVVLAILICEAALTRRMVQGGHAAIDSMLDPE